MVMNKYVRISSEIAIGSFIIATSFIWVPIALVVFYVNKIKSLGIVE